MYCFEKLYYNSIVNGWNKDINVMSIQFQESQKTVFIHSYAFYSFYAKLYFSEMFKDKNNYSRFH